MTGTIVSKEMLARMMTEKENRLNALETEEGYSTTPSYNPDIEDQLEAGRKFMKEYRETFKALAK